MNNERQGYMPFFASAMLMGIVLVIIYPWCQYYIDPDGIAYLTISKRYAAGDYANAINGYWSPWSCWLTAMLIRAGIQPIPSSIIINALGATGFLGISQSFFTRFDVSRQLQWILTTTLALFLCYAVFWQSFDDIWEYFFLLCALRIMLVPGYILKPHLWVITGIGGTLAYFAKAYSFPFFILNTLCCLYLLSRDNKAAWLKVSGITIAIMVLCSLPWICALHNKYGIWTTSTAGTLNTSWYLVGHPFYKPRLKGLLPPPYPGSPYYWEDPYMVNGAAPHFWNSWYLLGRQALKIAQNIYKLFRSMLQLSLLFPLIAFAAWLLLTSKKLKPVFTNDISIVALSFLLFPLGYVLVNFESRYIWYMLPLGMVMGAVMIQQFPLKIRVDTKWIYIAGAFTFLLYPMWCMCSIFNTGKDEYNWAQELKQHNIQGNFAGIVTEGKQTQSAARLAYFSGNSFYYLKAGEITESELLDEMKHYGVQYFYIYTYSSNGSFVIPQRAAKNGNRVAETDIGETNELKVFKIY